MLLQLPRLEHLNVLHAGFEYLALLGGVQLYRITKRRKDSSGLFSSRNFAIVTGCIFGAALGNKAVFWLEFPQLFRWDPALLLQSGQSMVGGLLGGLIGVEISKKLSGIRHSTGDDFVYPTLLGIMTGRVGCFLAGLSDGTYGVATALPWGVDFGDGIARHPTQLYEILFAGLLWGVLRHYQTPLAAIPGLRFKWMLCGYLLWRLAVDFIKPMPFVYFDFISGIQLVCLLALLVYLPITLILTRKLKT